MQCTAQRIQPVFYNNLAWNGKYNLQKHEDPRCPVVMTHASTAGGTDSIPGWGIRICMLCDVAKKKREI